MELNARRLQTGMGVCPLQIGQLLDWCRLKGIEDAEEVEEYAFYVFALDDAFVKHVAGSVNKTESMTDVEKGTGKGKRRGKN